ncbi:MAG TPA: bis-aminopropyl spermidine synthase family protein [Candidatus Dormibacteraeota bacterium]|nr:bis-aminopropyl spermidine synthase family protein [Candidatus Dormibacteraeota bacterium]
MTPDQRVLSILARASDPWEVAGRCRLPFPRLVQLLRDWERQGLVELAPGRIELTPLGRRRAGCQPDPDDCLRELTPTFHRLTAGRPPAEARFGQGHLTVDSVLARVRTMLAQGDLWLGVRVAVLGDDDLASLALALTRLPSRVTVFEIDRRVTAFIAEQAARLGLGGLEVHATDLRRPLPVEHLGGYDLFLTDPSETDAGLRMFIGRGLSVLRPGPGAAGYFGLTLIEADLAKWRRLQRWLLAQPVVVTAVYPDHGFYESWPTQVEEARAFGLACFSAAAERPWYRSSLYRLETLDGFRPPRPGVQRGELFWDEQCFTAAMETQQGR